MYRNRFEAKVGATLPDTFQYEAMRLPFVLTHQYLPDWIDEDSKSIVEAKGRFTATDRRKHLAIKAQYPDWTVTIVFQNPDRPLNKGSKTTYGGWCDKHGIAWRKA